MKPRKLNRYEFTCAIRNGLGSAFLHVMEYGDNGIEDVLLDACLNDHVFHHDLNNLRHQWLGKIIAYTGRRDFYAGKIATALQDLPQFEKDFDQLVWLAVYLYELGRVELRQILLELFEQAAAKYDTPSALLLAFVNLSGLPGLSTSARWLAKYTPDESGEMLNLFKHACTILSEDTVDSFLKFEANDSLLRTFRQTVEAACRRQELEKKWTGQPEAIYPPTFDQIISAINSASDFELISGLYHFAQNASQSELEDIFSRLEYEENPFRQYAYLRIFRCSPFLFPQITPAIMNFLSSKHERVRSQTVSILSDIKAPVVRDKALALMSLPVQTEIAEAIQLLESNYEPGDGLLIFEKLKEVEKLDIRCIKTLNLNDLENLELICGVVDSIWNISEQYPMENLDALLLWAYEFGPCAFKRHIILEKLINNHVASEQLLFEAQWDADDNVRSLARGLIN